MATIGPPTASATGYYNSPLQRFNIAAFSWLKNPRPLVNPEKNTSNVIQVFFGCSTKFKNEEFD
jgi:hypothetical protein